MQNSFKSEEALMKLKQISVPIENSHDRLYELTKALEDKGITPRALTLVDKGFPGVSTRWLPWRLETGLGIYLK
jgi:hypothetical protein